MKKILIVILVGGLLVLASCQSTPPARIDNTDINSDSQLNERLPNEAIGIRSVEELNYMRTMLSCTDQEKWSDYLRSVEGGGAHDKQDIANFINIVDSTPYVELIEGDISWISYKKGQNLQTGKPYEVLYVTVNATDGDWVRFEYMLSIADATKEVISQAAKLPTSSVALHPISNNDKRINIYSEQREKHPSGTGETIQWIATVDGIYTNIVFYSAKEDIIDVATMVNTGIVTSIAKSN